MEYDVDEQSHIVVPKSTRGITSSEYWKPVVLTLESAVHTEFIRN